MKNAKRSYVSIEFFSNYHQISQSSFFVTRCSLLYSLYFVAWIYRVTCICVISIIFTVDVLAPTGVHTLQPSPVLCTPICCITLICFILNINTKHFLRQTHFHQLYTLKFIQYNSAFCFRFLRTLSHRSTGKNFI